MKRLTLVMVIVLICLFQSLAISYAWDLPASFDILAISFRFTGSSAIAIKYSYGDSTIVTPEWKYNVNSDEVEWNKRFAYVKNTAPDVKVQFWDDGTPRGYSNLTIEATRVMGTPIWDLDSTLVSFVHADSNYTSFIRFSTESGTSIGSSVKDSFLNWRWRVVKVDGDYISPTRLIGNTFHDYYCVQSTPIAPMSEPWDEVLTKSTSYAADESTDSGIISDLTNMLYIGDYEYDIDTSRSNSTGVYLDSLLTDIINDSPTLMDCRDYSHFLNILAASLGVSSKYCKIDPFSGSNFDTNYLYPSGCDIISTINWTFHNISWFNSQVVDSATKIDNDADPTSSPHTWKLPVGDLSLASYEDKLSEDSLSTGSDYQTNVYTLP
ncbi:hypothetical protein ACFL30_03070 [Candidatus Latescibacterota bacterium]